MALSTTSYNHVMQARTVIGIRQCTCRVACAPHQARAATLIESAPYSSLPFSFRQFFRFIHSV